MPMLTVLSINWTLYLTIFLLFSAGLIWLFSNPSTIIPTPMDPSHQLRSLLSSIDSDLASSVLTSSCYGSESHRQPNKSRQRSSGRECSLYHPNGDRFTIAHERLSDVLEAELTPSSHSKLEYMSLPLNSTSNPEEFCRNFLEFTRNLFGREATHISYFLIFFSS